CDPSFRKRKVRNAHCEDFQYLEPIQALNADLDLFQIKLAFSAKLAVQYGSGLYHSRLSLHHFLSPPTILSPHSYPQRPQYSPCWSTLTNRSSSTHHGGASCSIVTPHWLGNKSKNFFISSTYL